MRRLYPRRARHRPRQFPGDPAWATIVATPATPATPAALDAPIACGAGRAASYRPIRRRPAAARRGGGYLGPMAIRSLSSLSLSFGLVSIPVKVYTATESAAAVRFKLMSAGGGRLRQQYVAEPPENDEVDLPNPTPPPRPEVASAPESAPKRGATERVVDFPTPRRAPSAIAAEPEREPADPVVVARSEMVKGYEFEKGRFVLFGADELEALAGASRQTIDIVAFAPAQAIDPIYYDKAYFLAPDKRGGKPYSLLLHALQDTGRTALAKWAWRSKEYVVQIRPVEGGLVLQQLLYADEVRSIGDLHVELAEVSEAELKLARQLIEQSAVAAYDPTQFVDEEKQRLMAAIEKKIAGEAIATPGRPTPVAEEGVVDLMAALRASLAPAAAAVATERKPARRAAKPAGARRSA